MKVAGLTKKELQALGFSPFGDCDLMLVPARLRKKLKGIKVVTIFGKVIPIEQVSSDTKGGFLACGIYPKDAKQRLVLEDFMEE